MKNITLVFFCELVHGIKSAATKSISNKDVKEMKLESKGLLLTTYSDDNFFIPMANITCIKFEK